MTQSAVQPRGTEALVGDMSFLLARASALSNAAGNASLVALGLKVRSYSVLELAAGGTLITQREIADFLRLDPSQVVPLVDDLQGSGLVTRQPDTRDRRANVVISTAVGQELLARARQALSHAEQEAHSHLTADEREALTALVRKAAFPD